MELPYGSIPWFPTTTSPGVHFWTGSMQVRLWAQDPAGCGVLRSGFRGSWINHVWIWACSF